MTVTVTADKQATFSLTRMYPSSSPLACESGPRQLRSGEESRSSPDRSATRMALRKGRGDERIAKLQDSPDMPESEATYKLAVGSVLFSSNLSQAITRVGLQIRNSS